MRLTKALAARWAKRLATAGLLVLALQACSPPAEQAPIKIATTRAGFSVWAQPKPVPDVSFVDGEGTSHSLANFHGKVVLLNLWATWCGPCREEMPTLDRLQAKLGSTDFQVLALSLDQAGEQVVRDFYRDIGIQHLGFYIDKSAQAAITLSALGLPTTLLLDRQGRELGRKLGAAEWDSPAVIDYLRETINSTERTQQ